MARSGFYGFWLTFFFGFYISKPEFDCKMIRLAKKYQFMTRFLVSPFPDPPEITVESPVVYSGEGQEAMLVCIVHGEAQPEVSHFPASFYGNSLTCWASNGGN